MNININNKSVSIDRLMVLFSLPGTFHFIYYIVALTFYDTSDKFLGTQFSQKSHELRGLINENGMKFLIFHNLSLLVFMISLFVFVLKKLTPYNQKVLENDQTKRVASDWKYAIIGTIAPYLVCFAIHACSQSIYRAGERGENFERLQYVDTILLWSVFVTYIGGYFFAVKFWAKHPSLKSKIFLLVILTTIHLVGLLLFNFGIYIFFGGPFTL